MKIASTLLLATVAFAALAVESTTAEAPRAHLTPQQAKAIKQRLFHPLAKSHEDKHVENKKPAPKHVEAKKTEAKKPVAKKVEAKKPVAKKVEQPKKPAAKKPVVKKPEAPKPVAKKPEAKKADPKKIVKPVVKMADALKPVVKKPVAKKPVIKMAPAKAHKAAPKKVQSKTVAKKPVVHMRKPVAPSFKVTLKNIASAAHKPKLEASDLNEGEGNRDVLRGPFEGPRTTLLGKHEETPASDSLDHSGSGSNESDKWDDSGSGSGVSESTESVDSGSGSDETENLESEESGDGSDESVNAESDDSGDGSGVIEHWNNVDSTDGSHEGRETPSNLSGTEESSGSGEDESTAIGLFDKVDGSEEGSEEGSEGDDDGDDESSESEDPVGSTQDIDDLKHLKKADHKTAPKKPATKHEHKPKKHASPKKDTSSKKETSTKHAKQPNAKATKDDKARERAGSQLATRVDSSAFHVDGYQPLMLIGSIVGAVVGVLAVIVGVLHLRRQQSESEQSTLAAELPEPQTGRDDAFEATNVSLGEDALASSSVDLEEALNKEEKEEEEEGAFTNGALVV